MSEESSGTVATVETSNETLSASVTGEPECTKGKRVNRPRVYNRNQQGRWKQSSAKDVRGGKRPNTRREQEKVYLKDRNSEWERSHNMVQGACYLNSSAPDLFPAHQQKETGSNTRHLDTTEKRQGHVTSSNSGGDSARLKEPGVHLQSDDSHKDNRYRGEKSVSQDTRKTPRRGKPYPPSMRGQFGGRGISRGYPTIGSWKFMHGLRDNGSLSQHNAIEKALDIGRADGKDAFKQPHYHRESDKTEDAEMDMYNASKKLREFDRGIITGKRGKRSDLESQKIDVIRALGHLNPVQSSQASALIEQLRNETYECMVCCERVRCSAAVWSCESCFHVFHLGCVRKWATCPAATANLEGENGGWRCPGCQNISYGIPSVYSCFCGKVLYPEWRRTEGLTPHTCGELCGKQRADSECPHRCNQLCHPGPCPSCPVMVTKLCACGKTSNRVRCGQATTVLCQQVCNKVLNCFAHRCTRICHTDPCGDCQIKVQQTCYCGKQQRETLCGTGKAGFDNRDGKSGYFSCQKKCSKVLDCGNHHCQRICHPGTCSECLLKPSLVTCCPCGKALVTELLNEGRASCLDPVPTCSSTCDKVLSCSPQRAEGSSDKLTGEHRCKKECHVGDCGPCDGITKVKCRCGRQVKEIPCVQINMEEYRCEKRCNKKRNCGRHKCNEKCCVDTEHRCEFVCGRKLNCGLHKCMETCHRGNCPPCLMSGFDELTCHCGAEVMLPPIPCGTKPPECDRPCSRTHACLHPVYHSCHSEDDCPPCPYLTKKKCMGDHEFRHNIPCHVKHISCGKVCGKSLSCGHKCLRICHKPPCLGSEESCVQPCEQLRKECGHQCAAPCHWGKDCPNVPCETKVTVHCKCGLRSEVFPCLQGGEKVAVTKAYQRIATETLANKMKDLQSGQSVDISSIVSADDKRRRQLECKEECAVYERNKCLAEALNIENPDLSQHGGIIRYSPFLIAEAKQHLTFVKFVEDAFENLVQTTLKMSVSQRSHSFPPMNLNQRRFIHELAMFYNCSTHSYDREPKRNTVIFATKESHLPNVKLSIQIEKEINPPPPRPIPFLPSRLDQFPKPLSNQAPKKTQAWTQLPDYFADDFDD